MFTTSFIFWDYNNYIISPLNFSSTKLSQNSHLIRFQTYGFFLMNEFLKIYPYMAFQHIVV